MKGSGEVVDLTWLVGKWERNVLFSDLGFDPRIRCHLPNNGRKGTEKVVVKVRAKSMSRERSTSRERKGVRKVKSKL
jgi:hypothetical protein